MPKACQQTQGQVFDDDYAENHAPPESDNSSFLIFS